jgi:hypothetical protein
MKVYVNITQEVEIDDRFTQLLDEECAKDWYKWHTLHHNLCDTIKEKMNMPFSTEEAAKNTDKSIESVYTTDWCCLIET